MFAHIKRVENALADLRQGKMIILTDHPDRENEGDLIVLAEKITPEIMNFMIRQGTGIVCLALTTEKCQQLQLSLMVSQSDNQCTRGTQFTVSIDAKEGITTGVSAFDRVTTIKSILDPQATTDHFVKPGHIFPLQARAGGVLERPGHTEGAVDLARLAGSQSAAVICEIMNADGSMAKGKELENFSRIHQLTTLSIDDVIAYRLMHETMIENQVSINLPLHDYGSFNMSIIKEKFTHVEHIVLMKSDKSLSHSPLVRIHSSCTTGDLFSSTRCDCHQQLHHALKRISEEGGILIYLQQEGRGIGLFNKLKAYALQDHGLDTVTANQQLGFAVDARQYYIAAHILRHFNVGRIKLMTNNPSKMSDLEKYGISCEREAMPTFLHKNNQFYLQTKKEKLHHFITI